MGGMGKAAGGREKGVYSLTKSEGNQEEVSGRSRTCDNDKRDSAEGWAVGRSN